MRIGTHFLLVSALVFSCLCPAANEEYTPELMRAMTFGAQTKVVLKVVDDDQVPVSNVTVHIVMGMNFHDKSYSLDGMTDTNGNFVIEGKTTGNRIMIRLSRDGFYSSSRDLHYIKTGSERVVENGRWLPWGAEERFVLRKARPSAKLTGFAGFLDVPATNQWLSFDLEKSNWVRPFGDGRVADVELFVEWDGLPKPSSKSCGYRMRIPGAENGGYLVDKMLDSEYSDVLIAEPEHFYDIRDFMWKERREGVYLRDTSMWLNKGLVLRTRCVKDEQGKIVSFNFSNLRKLEVSPSRKGCTIMELSYIFNPKPNDTNLEFCESRNPIREGMAGLSRPVKGNLQ